MNQVIDYFSRLFSAEGFPPRWFCGQWTAFTGWFYILSDVAIWTAYMSIPVILIYFISRRRDIPFPRIFWLFAAFIFACSATHLFDAAMFWWPAYRLSGLVYFITAVISWITIAVLIPILPLALALKSPTEFQQEIDERIKTEEALRRTKDQYKRIALQLERAKREAEEASQQKTKVLSYVSHDFKNPLAGIMRFIEILEKDQNPALSQRHRKIVENISEGVQQLQNMVVNILDKARAEQGQVTPILEWVELKPFIDSLKPLYDTLAAQRYVEIMIDIHPELPAIKADPTQLHQIIINLLSNAIKYNRVNGKVFLRFYKAQDEPFAIIEVQDTGLGIPPEKIPDIFTEYYRVNLSQSDSVEGTGLGLPFIKKLVELHHGTITVASEAGIGSTFKVTLPLSPMEALQQSNPSSISQ